MKKQLDNKFHSINAYETFVENGTKKVLDILKELRTRFQICESCKNTFPKSTKKFKRCIICFKKSKITKNTICRLCTSTYDFIDDRGNPYCKKCKNKCSRCEIVIDKKWDKCYKCKYH